MNLIYLVAFTRSAYKTFLNFLNSISNIFKHNILLIIET